MQGGFIMGFVHLLYFIAVAHHKSFSKAAEVSHVYQSVISKLVKNLEEELGNVEEGDSGGL